MIISNFWKRTSFAEFDKLIRISNVPFLFNSSLESKRISKANSFLHSNYPTIFVRITYSE